MAGAHGAKGKLSLKTAQIRIDVWSDYVCPFCYLEQPVLRRIARQYQGKVVLEWRAFELRPEPVPTLDPDCEYLHAIWNRAVYPMAHTRGMKLRLPPIQPRSRRAFEAAEFARAHGRFGEMHEALFRAFFQEGLDLGSLSVLLQVGAGIGLDTETFRPAPVAANNFILCVGRLDDPRKNMTLLVQAYAQLRRSPMFIAIRN